MFDVLIGVNLLREGLDLPEVALVAILDADTEGFLRLSLIHIFHALLDRLGGGKEKLLNKELMSYRAY